MNDKEYYDVHQSQDAITPMKQESNIAEVDQNNENVYDVDNDKKEDENSEDSLPDIINEDEEENTNRIELLDYLLNFVMNNNNELNYVLSGYFSNVLLFLMKKNSNKILKYIYSFRQDVIYKILQHSNQKAMAILAMKLLNIEQMVHNNTVNNKKDDNIIEYNTMISIRNNILVKIITSIKRDENQSFILEAIQELIYPSEYNPLAPLEISEPNIVLLSFILTSDDILIHLFGILKESPINDNLYCSVVYFLCEICKAIIKNNLTLPGTVDSNNTEVAPLYGKLIVSSLSYIIHNFKERQKKDNSLSSVSSPNLGMVNVSIIELVINLFPVFKNVQEKFDLILIRNSFIKKATDFFFKYQFNDIYRQLYLSFLKLYLTENNIKREVTKYLFTEIKLQSLLLNKIKNVPKFEFQHGNTINDPIYPFLIALCYKINYLSGKDLVKLQERKGSFNFLKEESEDNSLINRISNYFVGFKDKTSLLNSPISGYLSDDWNLIFQQKVLPIIELYENKLEVSNPDNSINDSNVIENEDEEEEEENSNVINISVGKDTTNRKVDEIEITNYSDVNYWKESERYKITMLNEAMKDLLL